MKPTVNSDNLRGTRCCIAAMMALLIPLALHILAPQSGAREYGEINGVTFAAVIDGEEFTAELGPAGSMPEVFRVINVRLKGVDTPERLPQCGSPQELFRVQQIHLKATLFTLERLSTAQQIDLVEVERGGRFRLIARVIYDGKDLAAELLESGLAKVMEDRKLPVWCEP